MMAAWQVVLRVLLEGGLLHGDVMTVTGKTMAENLKEAPTLPQDQDVILPLEKPFAPAGQHIVVLRGNLAPDSCVCKVKVSLNVSLKVSLLCMCVRYPGSR